MHVSRSSSSHSFFEDNVIPEESQCTKNEIQDQPLPKSIDEMAKEVFNKLKITEWYLPTTEGPSVGTLSAKQPKAVFSKSTNEEIGKIQQMINNSVANPDIPLPNVILQGPAGVGKTMLVEQLCRSSDIGFIRIPSGTMENLLKRAEHITALQDIKNIANLCSTVVYLIMDDGEELVAQRSSEVKKSKKLDDEIAPWLKTQEEIGETIAQRRTALVNWILEASGKDFRKEAYAITTNRGKVIDGAFRTRSLVLKIYPPDLQERIRIIATHLPRIFNNEMLYLGFFNQGRLEEMGRQTEGFTGRNIVNMLKSLRACVQLEENKNDAESLMTGLSQEIVNASIYEMRRSLERENQLQKNSNKTFLGIKKSNFKATKIIAWMQSFMNCCPMFSKK